MLLNTYYLASLWELLKIMTIAFFIPAGIVTAVINKYFGKAILRYLEDESYE